jgi:hypothetical protein
MRKQTRDRPDLYNENQLGLFMQCSVIAYASAGAFQNLAHYDLYYGLLAIIVIARHLLEQKLKLPVPEGVLQPALADDGQPTNADDQTVLVPEHAHARSFLRTQTEVPAGPEGRSFLR